MASKLLQLQSKASEASKFVAKNGSAYYKQLLEQNKQYIQEPSTVEKCNELSKQLFYTRLARCRIQLYSMKNRKIIFWGITWKLSLVVPSHFGRSLIM
ncbi:hypothetical protein ERO13_A05G028600v2 [Gossypium hirsutum]|uniref:Uncharacterized protein n=1 Tax=Gossypium tomentosum TaxID=34277 RepID=A0A5D2QD13_GOSTO|nr:hypothetical protein ERO13_A05G028600v2 [Gossypium hirsutum]KAG4197526.1 hypothetical protein ERO13_A05G028600v2 [Gossypium hirsutum]TYI25153.1 hypothetical protein ES332_A05G031600v1 [Gossypium tomentosum]TYI25154.1 hypothetical protein ES332_A05G031600v1 [Gossypium tomentosum]